MRSENSVLVLDETVLANLGSFLCQEKIAHLLRRYLEDSTRIIQQLGDACEQEHAEEICRLAHSLRSTSANVGALAVSALAGELEELSRQGGLSGVRHQINLLMQAFLQVKQGIEGLKVMSELKLASG